MTTYTETFRVRYAETDKMGIAHHSNYFIWFEMGRSDFCRDAGFPYTEWEAHGIYTPLVEVACRYKSPLLYDELVTMEVSVKELTAITITFAYRLYHADGKLVCEGSTKHAFTNPEGHLLRGRNEYLDKLKKYTTESLL